jgi:signal transduction histidine kinase
MLHDFIAANRGELISRCRTKASHRNAPKATAEELEHGIPLFLEQLTKILRAEQQSAPLPLVSQRGDERGADLEMCKAAVAHGSDLMERGFTVEQVVHDYGDVCQAVTDLAHELKAPIATEEFRTFNRCLDNVIADAVTEYSRRSTDDASAKEAQSRNNQMDDLGHKLRYLLHTATLAIVAIKGGNVGLSGATGSVLDRCMVAMRDVIDKSIADVRVKSGIPAKRRVISLADFVGDVRISALLEGKVTGCRFSVGEVAKELAIDVDENMLFAAVRNLLQNGFKFTKPNTEVSLRAHGDADRVYIEVEDHCGGLEPEAAERMFLPFVQNGEDISGHGGGLIQCQRDVEANDGILRVKDIANSGCVFTIDLPRHQLLQD